MSILCQANVLLYCVTTLKIYSNINVCSHWWSNIRNFCCCAKIYWTWLHFVHVCRNHQVWFRLHMSIFSQVRWRWLPTEMKFFNLLLFHSSLPVLFFSCFCRVGILCSTSHPACSNFFINISGKSLFSNFCLLIGSVKRKLHNPIFSDSLRTEIFWHKPFFVFLVKFYRQFINITEWSKNLSQILAVRALPK